MRANRHVIQGALLAVAFFLTILAAGNLAARGAGKQPTNALIRSAQWWLGQHMPLLAGGVSGVVRTKHGYAVYVTVLLNDGRPAFRVKVCENVRAQVTGVSNVTNGGGSCD